MGIRVCVNYSLRTARDSFSGRVDRFMVFATTTVGEAMPAYDAVVIGSGYGGGVAASRLARMGLRLAVLEQGRLWRPGDFPTTGKARLKTLRLTGRAKLGDPAGLYYLSVGKGLTVFGASGLGGGSLINAGVTLRPDLGRLRKAGWPDAVVAPTWLHEKLLSAWLIVGPFKLIEATRFPTEWGDEPVCHFSIRTLAIVIFPLASVTTANWYTRTFGSLLA